MAITKNSQIDLNGNEMILDADGDTKIDAATDDEIHFTVAGSETVYMGVTSYNASDRLVLTNTGGNASATIVAGTSGESSIFMADGTSGDASYRGYVQYQHTNDNFNIGTGGAQRLRIDSDGLKFGSDTAAANALDDYEEGTFTPTVTSGITSVGYSAQTGYYTRIGNLVLFNLRVVTSSGNAQSSTFAVGNLPFNSAATQQPGGAAIRAYASSFSGSASQAFIGPASNSISFFTLSGTAFAGTSITDHDGFDLRITGIYRA